MFSRLFCWFAVGVLTSVCNSVSAADTCPHCGHATFKMVVQTVMAPAVVQKPQKLDTTKCVPVYGECTVTEIQRIPIHKTVTRECVKMLPQKLYRTECYTVCKPVWEQVTRESTELVSEPIVKSCMRTVCKEVPVPATRIVCVDEGHWETDKSGCRTWVSKPVKKEVRYVKWESQWVEEPYEYTVFETRCEKRSFTVNITCRFECEKRTRKVPYTVYVPTKVTETFTETTYVCVPVQRTKKYIKEWVPQKAAKFSALPERQMVPKQVLTKIAVPCGCRATKLAGK